MTGFLSGGIEPSLIHAQDITIQRADFSTTDYDDDLREPTGDVQFMEPEIVFAQIHWISETDKRKMGPGGDDPQIAGWITLRRSDLEDIPLGGFKKSDKIIKVEGLDGVEDDFSNEPLVIDSIDSKGHYTTSKLIRYFFKRRDTSFGG